MTGKLSGISLLQVVQSYIGRHRIILSFIAGVTFIYFSTPTRTAIIAGTPFVLLGEMIRTWASGFIKKDKELAQEGPYALTRNPLYLGNFLIGLGFSIMAYNPILLTLFLLAFSLIYIFTIRNEEKSLSARFGDAYIAYKSKVPAFFPLRIIPDQRDFSLNFDWQLIWKHREHHTWLGIFGCLIIFILRAAY